MGELAAIMRKGRHFLITNANSFHWLQAPQKMSQIWMNTFLSWTPGYKQYKPYEGFKMYVMYLVKCGKIWNNFLKRMHDNRTMKESYAI